MTALNGLPRAIAQELIPESVADVALAVDVFDLRDKLLCYRDRYV